MNYITTRKIKVVGCLNCPYHTVTEKVINEETKEKSKIDYCIHPSFECTIPIDKECIDRLKSGLPQRMTYSYFPEWCPLEMDNCIGYCNPVN